MTYSNNNSEKNNQNKEAAKQVAAALDQLAAELVGVQPMAGVAGKIFSMKPKYSDEVSPPWEAWHRYIVIWPRRSIYGKIVLGIVNRSSRDEFEVPFGTYMADNQPGRFHRYATNKELFTAKLDGTA